MNSISFFKALLMKELDEKELSDKQKKIAKLDPPSDELDTGDFKKLRSMKKEMNTPSTPTDFSGNVVRGINPIVDMEEGEDHEVSMAHNSLESIVKSAMELKMKLGDNEKNIPAWIQDHITNAENYINQASKNYHEYSNGEHDMDELPDGTVELPAGDEEDLDMSLKGMMENLKKKKLKEFGPSIANVSKESFKIEDVINWFQNKLASNELMYGLPKQFQSFIKEISRLAGDSGYIPANLLFHIINDYVSQVTPGASPEDIDMEDRAQSKHAKELYSAIRRELTK